MISSQIIRVTEIMLHIQCFSTVQTRVPKIYSEEYQDLAKWGYKTTGVVISLIPAYLLSV
jgi:hypothetical protein